MDNKDLDNKDLGDLKNFLNTFKEVIRTMYDENKINTIEINDSVIDYLNKKINLDNLCKNLNKFNNEFNKFNDAKNNKKLGAIGPNQKKLINYGKMLKK